MTKSNNIKSKFFSFLIIGLIALILFTCASHHRVGCRCIDGTNSSATGRGACSHHGGVMYWQHDYWWD